MNAELADFLARAAATFESLTNMFESNDRKRLDLTAQAQEARRYESAVRAQLSAARTGWISHEEAASPDSGYDE